MVGTQLFHCQGLVSIPGQGTKILLTSGGQKKKKKSNSKTISNAVQELSFIAGGNSHRYSHFGRLSQFLIKLNIPLPPDLAITFLSIYPNELKS